LPNWATTALSFCVNSGAPELRANGVKPS
jgi:hypothetical protein